MGVDTSAMRGAVTTTPDAYNDARKRVDYDYALYERAFGARWSASARIWKNVDCLVVPLGWSSRPGFEVAAERSGHRGWPVVLRRTGGSCVPHGRGVVNVSLVRSFPQQDAPSSYAEYELIINTVGEALGEYGLEVSAGAVRGSICDGDWNICIGDKKLGGTAQRRVTRGGTTVSLTHASLFVGDVGAGLEASARMLQDMSLTRFDPSVQCLLTRDAGVSEAEFTRSLYTALMRSEQPTWHVLGCDTLEGKGFRSSTPLTTK